MQVLALFFVIYPVDERGHVHVEAVIHLHLDLADLLQLLFSVIVVVLVFQIGVPELTVLEVLLKLLESHVVQDEIIAE